MEECPITFHLLHKDELSYEVSIRGEKPVDSYPELKKQIRELSQRYPSDEVDSFDGDVPTELTLIQGKVDELVALVSGSRLALKNLNRIQSLTHHLYHRLGRVSPVRKEDLVVYEQLFSKFQGIKVKVDGLLTTFKSSQESIDPEPGPPKIADMVQAQEIRVSCSKNKGVHTLNVKYSGRSCVVAFIQRLEELCLSRQITDAELFASAVELFVDDASFWYRSVCAEVNSWTELKQLLLDEYLPFDFDYRLMQEIRTRTQGPEEGINTYLSVMKNYFNRLRKEITEEEQLNIVKYGIRPFYSAQLALVNITSWSDLKTKCKLLEHANYRALSFKEPPAFSNNMLCPDLAVKVTSSQCSASADRRVEEISRANDLFCVQCRTVGHLLRDCRAPKLIICYRCGYQGVTMRNCPQCVPNHSDAKKN
jgi:hypothetical protein